MRTIIAVAGLALAVFAISGCTTSQDLLPPSATNIQKIDEHTGTFEMTTPDGRQRKFLYHGRRLESSGATFTITELK